MMSFDIYENLELADSPELFRSDANIERYGLIPSPPDPKSNPDGLPIGVTKQETKEGRWKGVAAGINCAACHNSELHYQGRRIRIDGDVANHFDIQALFHCADDAMQATLRDSAKFDRLAARIGTSTADAKKELRERFERDAERIHYFVSRVMVPPHDWGPGRMDALNLIVNRKLTLATKIAISASHRLLRIAELRDLRTNNVSINHSWIMESTKRSREEATGAQLS